MAKKAETICGVMRVQCATCPFREDGYKDVRELLVHRALQEATPICHSTGPGAIVPRSKRVSKKPLACRGARNLQLQVFFSLGFLEAPTDAAWEKKAMELGL